MTAAKRRRRGFSSSNAGQWIPVPIIALCSLLLCAAMLFGLSSPSLLSIASPNATISSCTIEVAAEPSSRTDNIKLAVEAINGAEIPPGESFALNATLNIANDDKYVSAPALDGVFQSHAKGGGVSQLASALYVAALKADLSITDRRAHAVVVDYIDMGLDASVLEGQSDLIIKNTSTRIVKIAAEFSDLKLTVRIKGAPLEGGRTIDVVSEVEGFFDNDFKLLDASVSLAEQPDNSYCMVKTYRVYSVMGVEEKRVPLNDGKADTYLVARHGVVDKVAESLRNNS